MKAFSRNVEVIVEDKIIKYPDLDLSFSVNFDTGSDANVGNIKVYNLSRKSINLLKKDKILKIKAGYKEDLGEIFSGVISSVTTKWENSDKVTEIVIGDHSKDWLKATINTTWRTEIKASQVIKDIADKLPFEIGKIEIEKDKLYPKGKTFSKTCKAALEELAKDLDLKLHVNKGKIYLLSKHKGTEQVIVLNKDTGLISSPQDVSKNNEENRYKLKALLNYRIETDSILKIESKTINDYYRVYKGEHYLNGNDFLTEVEVVKYESK